jgi:hypothetical protein
MTLNVFSTDKHLDRDAWNVILAKNAGIPDPGNRGVVIEQVSSGIEEHRRRYATAAHRRPFIAVPLRPLQGELATREGSMFYSSANNTIVITRAYLQNMHVLPLDRDVELRGAEQETFAVGPAEKLWFLGGVEESDHSLWRQDGLPSGSAVGGERLVLCDMQPIEFRALERQLALAIELGFPSVTVQLLRQRVMNAQYLREILGLQQ